MSPTIVMYVGAGAFGFGLLVLLVSLIPARKVMELDAVVATYTTTAGRGPVAEAKSKSKREAKDVVAGAKQAAGDLLRHNASLEARIAARLEAAGSELKPAEWLLLHLGIVVVAGTLGTILSRGNIFIAIVFTAAGIAGPWLYLSWRKNKRRKAFHEALPDTLQLMSGSLAAGLSLAQSIDTVVKEGAEPLSSEFKRAIIETRLGVSIEDALSGVAERFTSDDFGWVVMAIRTQRQVGGNLAQLFDTVANTMRERQYVRRQVDSLAAEGKLSAWVIGALPPVFALYLAFANPTYLHPLYSDPRGLVMIAAGLLFLGIGVFAMSKIVKVEV